MGAEQRLHQLTLGLGQVLQADDDLLDAVRRARDLISLRGSVGGIAAPSFCRTLRQVPGTIGGE